MNDFSMSRRIAEAVKNAGGETYFVGGFVRDELLGKDNKDIDIEVHGVKPEVLEGILSSLGEVKAFGKSFAIWNLSGYDIDIAIPRTERPTAEGGHRGFEVTADPFLGTVNAAKRRDFTINALMKNVLTGEVVDHFGGVNDLKEGVIRHVCDKTFVEDPLRVLRAAQFAARFGFRVADETKVLCRTIDISGLSKERIMEETRKALLKAPSPSMFFEMLRDMNQLDTWFPEMKALDVPQSKKWHQEGSVWNHTMMVIDEAAKFRDKASNPIAFMLSAVVHDMGKPAVTFLDEDGGVHAYGHEDNIEAATAFLQRIVGEKEIKTYALNMAQLHMAPHKKHRDNAKIKSTNKMFDASINAEDLILLAIADSRGRLPCSEADVAAEEAFLKERLAIYREYMSRPYVMGRDLVEAGLKPDETFTKKLEYAHKLRLAGVPKKDALTQTIAFKV